MPPTDYTALDTPRLAVEVAQRWQLTKHTCPGCHGALYAQAMLAPIQMGHLRCPRCKENFLQRGGVQIPDRGGDEMLDELARRSDLISNPVRFTQLPRE